MSNECSDFDITEALSEEEQAELLAQGSKQEPVCPYPDFTVDKGGKTHLQATYANFEAMCRMQGISVQKDIIRRTYRIPPDIATRFSMDGAVDAFCVELQDRCTREGIRTNDKQVQKGMKTAADAHRVNPVRQYLEQQFKRYPAGTARRNRDGCIFLFRVRGRCDGQAARELLQSFFKMARAVCRHGTQ